MHSLFMIFNQNNIKSILKVAEKHVILPEVRSTIISYNIYNFFPSWLNYGSEKRRKKRYIHLISPKKRLQRLHNCFITILGGYKCGYNCSTNPKLITKTEKLWPFPPP